MTRKHFKALAERLNASKPRHANYPLETGDEFKRRYEQWFEDCEMVASACRQFNPQFDLGRFREACGE